jgi:DNA repair exonuclease SbcCD ATPase subunit
MLKFTKVRWKNFLSTGNYWTEIDLCKNKTTLIVGSNGNGKSTLTDALCFGLFNKAFRNINKTGLVNSINNKDCAVEIEFETNSKKYKIVRGIKPNIFEIYQNDELLNQEAASKDYQEILEKNILKLNYKSFTQIVILGSASFTPFMQLSAADRRAIIEDLLDIQIFSAMSGVVKDRLSIQKDSISSKKYDFDLQQQKFEMQKKHIEDLKQNNEEKIKEYEKEISHNSNSISAVLAQINTIAAEIEKLQLVVNNKIETEIKIKKITKLESQIEINLSKIRKDIDFFQEHDNCPTCRQTIASSFKEEELTTLSTKATECETGLSELEKKLAIEQQKIQEITEKQTQIQTRQVKIASLNTTIIETNKYIEKLKKQIEELRTSNQSIEKEESKLNDIKKEIKNLAKELKELIEEKTYLETASTLLKDTGIKTRIIKQYLPVINKLVNKYLSALEFFVNFNLDETFKETIKSRHRDEFVYNNFSEGEKSRIDISLLLTWRSVAKLKNSINTNLLILDEIFDSSLDQTGTDYLMNLLHILEGTNLFVISHKGDVLQDKFENTITFIKDKNFSRIKT